MSELNKIERLKFYCQKVLPLVYDDSLSYYEVLCKIGKKLNELIDNNGEMIELVEHADTVASDMIEFKAKLEQDFDNYITTTTADLKQKYNTALAQLNQDFDEIETVLSQAYGDTTDALREDYTQTKSELSADYTNYKAELLQTYENFLEQYQRQFGVVQGFGESTTDAISQKAITDALTDNVETHNLFANNNEWNNYYIYEHEAGSPRQFGTTQYCVAARNTSILTTRNNATNAGTARLNDFRDIKTTIHIECDEDYVYSIYAFNGYYNNPPTQATMLHSYSEEETSKDYYINGYDSFVVELRHYVDGDYINIENTEHSHISISYKTFTLANKVNVDDIKQELGNSEEYILSQKVITDNFNSKINNYGFENNFTNITDMSTLQFGFLNKAGAFTSQLSYHTIYADVSENNKYQITGTIGQSTSLPLCCFYNSDNQCIGYFGEGSAEALTPYTRVEVTLPKGTTRIGITSRFSSQEPAIYEDVAQEIDGSKLVQYIKKYNKNILNFGDSIFGNYSVDDISKFISQKTGCIAYNVGFGGCRMSRHSSSLVNTYGAFSMFELAYSIANNDWTKQDNAIVNFGSEIPRNYVEHLTTLKNTNYNEVNAITIAYGTNDFSSGVNLDNDENEFDTTTLGGALRYSIENILNIYPNIEIFVCTPTFRFYSEESEGSYVIVETSDTKINGTGKKLIEYVNKIKEVANEYHLKCIDNYNELGINKNNCTYYIPISDGTHPNVNGRKLIGNHIANEIF